MKQIMYIGPEIEGLVRKNQIFTYRPDDIVKKAAEIYAPAKHFFVSMDDIVAMKNELRRQGSFLNTAYKQIEKEIMRR